MLHLDASQEKLIREQYATKKNFHQLYTEDSDSQENATTLLRSHGLEVMNLGDLGNCWSKRCSKQGGSRERKYTRILLQW